MLLFKARKFSVFLSALFVLTLTSCGFQPLHGKNYTGHQSSVASQALFSNIRIANIPNRSGQYLRNQMIDALYNRGQIENPKYELRIQNLSEQITRLGIRRDASSTRAQMRISATLDLYNLNAQKSVLTRDIRATNSFNILDSQFSTQVSEQYARERALDDIARQVITEISLLNQRGIDIEN